MSILKLIPKTGKNSSSLRGPAWDRSNPDFGCTSSLVIAKVTANSRTIAKFMQDQAGELTKIWIASVPSGTSQRRTLAKPSVLNLIKYILKTIIIWLLFCLSASAAPINKHATVQLIEAGFSPQQNSYLVGLEFKLAPGWKLYGKDEQNMGTEPQANWKQVNNLLSAEFKWPSATKVTDDFGINSFAYYDHVIIPILLTPQGIKSAISGVVSVSYALCNNICIPVTTTLNINLMPGLYDEQIAATITKDLLSTDPPAQLLMIILLALLGGLILNAMPCVLPVLSIKILSILKQHGMSRNQVRANFLSISAGIIVSFLLLALITLTMQYLGHEVGFGLHFQQPIFIITLILILVFFACNLLGIFEINLPSKINDLVLRSDSNNQLISHFLCGVFATIMATPCTAPFVGTAIGFALSSNWSNVILIFIAMGCGMALPFLILSALPQLVYFLPRPGPWMVVIKKLFGYLLFVTVIWLLYVTAGQLGTLPSLILFLLCVLIKFSLEHHNFLLKSTRSRFTIISIIIALSYILPLSLSGQLSVQENTANKIWQDFDETKIAQLIADNKIILIDITAAWCPSCQYNKLMVFKQAPIIQYLQEHDIVTMRANITSPDAKALAFIKKYNRHGIPFNIILSKAVPQGILLPEIFNQDELLKALKKAELK